MNEQPAAQESKTGGGAPVAGPPSAAGDYELSIELIYAVEDALGESQTALVRELVQPLHPADLADLIEYLTPDERQQLIEILGPGIDAEVLVDLEPEIRVEVIKQIGPRELARALSELDSDDALEIFEGLRKKVRRRLLAKLPKAHRQLIEESLSYPEDSAGRLMQRKIVAVPSAWTVGETIDYMRAAKGLPDDFYDLFVVSPKHHPLGAIPLSRVLRAKRPIRLTEIMDGELKVIPLTMDQEDVAYTFRQYGLVSAPVVDETGRLVGAVMVDDVVRVIDDEAEEDLAKLSGLAEFDLYRATLDTTKARFPWLVVNLLTAILASIVIGFFEGTIEKLVALAVLLPIVASMGGNAGTQTLTVAVRAIAMKDLTAANIPRFIWKEVLVGSSNGVMFAILSGIVAWLWFGDPALGMVIGAAMILNMMVAALFGTLIPLGLEKLKIDPAIASSVFLTTVTDVVGFFAFLGLAAVFLL